MERRFVQQQTVRQLTMLAEGFAVIADDNDDRLRAVDRGEHTAGLRVDVLHFAVVRLGVGRWRRVRRMRVVQMHPREPRTRVGAAKPSERAIYRLPSAALRLERRLGIVRIADDLVVVRLESARKAEAMIEHERADERASAISGFRKKRRER